MTTLQKIPVVVATVAAVGVGIYEARQAATLRHQVQVLQREQTSLSDEIRQLQRERNETINRLAYLSFTNDVLKSGVNVVGILTDKNFRVVVHALEQRTGVETLGEPEATTTGGRGIQGRFINVVFPVFTNPPPSGAQRRTE